jgi:AraC-like DNA-binding protein
MEEPFDVNKSVIKPSGSSGVMAPLDGYEPDEALKNLMIQPYDKGDEKRSDYHKVPDADIDANSGAAHLEDLIYKESGAANIRSELALDFCGFERCKPGHSFGPFARSIFIVHAVLEGSGTLQIDGKTYHIGPNQAFLLPPQVETLYWADKKDPWHYCWIGYHGTLAPMITRRIGLSKENPVIRLNDTELIENLIKNMLRYFEFSMHDRLMRTGLLCTILAHMIEKAVRDKDDDFEDDGYELPYHKYAALYIQMHYREKIRIAQLADKIGISRSYLTKLMQSNYGLSPQEFLIKIRMENAAHFLNHTEDSIREIAADVGYDDPLAFSKAFRQYYDASPSEFRARFDRGEREDHLRKK